MGYAQKLSESSVAADGSLFLALGLVISVNCISQSNYATNTSYDTQDIHIDLPPGT